MSLAEVARSRGRRALLAATAGAGMVATTLVAAGPAHADEVYPRPYTNVITLAGHGYGHGHGMSQWGAYGAASQGKAWQDIVGFYYPGTGLSQTSNSTIRVRLDQVGSGTLYVYTTPGLAMTGGDGSTRVMDQANPEYRIYTLATSGAMHVDALVNNVWTPYADMTSPVDFSASSSRGGSDMVDVYVPAAKVRRSYRGDVLAYWNSASSIVPVSVLPMEDYLRAVVPAEMPASWTPGGSIQGLAAQAVAARTYAGYDRAHTPQGRSWDTCDTTWCQMYSGYADLPTGQAPVVREKQSSNDAVAGTAGWMVTVGGAPAFTQFGAANGGWTAAGSQPYLTAQPDPFDGVFPNGSNTWSTSVPVSTVEAAWPAIGTYLDMRVTARDGHGEWGGRITQVVFEGTKGSVTVSGDTARGKLGLKSEWFVPTNPPNPRSAPSYPRDFTADDKADVLAAVGNTGELRLYAGNGAGGWQPTQVIGTGGWNTFAKLFTAGTWDGDAISDVMGQKGDGTLWLYPGTATGALGAPRQIGTGWGMHNLVFPVGDFGGDGMTDLIARRASDGALFLYSGDSQGGFGPTRQIGAGWNIFSTVFSPGDFTGDGKADLLARTRSGYLYLYPGNGSGGFQPRRLIGRGWNIFSAIVSAGDFNGDGRSDVLARTWDGTLYLYPGNGAGGWLPRRVVGRGWNIFSTILP